MGVMITCRNLTRRFGEFTAVNGLSFQVAPGAICAFLGPNGAGKSTTVKMLTGLLTPTSGEVQVCGLDPRTTTVGAIAETPNATIDSDTPLDEAFAFLEENDYERVPVIDGGRLVGVLSRSTVRRRLAEDSPPPAAWHRPRADGAPAR